MALYKTGKYEEAVAAQQKALDLAPGCKRKEFSTRLAKYKKTLAKYEAKPIDPRKDPNHPLKKLFDEYFAAVSNSATIEQTRPIAEKIIESNNQIMMNQFAWDIMTKKNIDDAKRDYEIAVKVASIANTITKGKNCPILDTYAMALYKTGKYEEAVKAASIATTITKGKNGPILDTYAMALYKTGKYEEAVAAQQKAVNLAPGCMRKLFSTRLAKYKKALAK
jgi:tetratricopeptide (TPR) repeat protein